MLQATPNAGRPLVASEVPAVSAPELAALQGQRARQRTSAPQREDSMLWAWGQELGCESTLNTAHSGQKGGNRSLGRSPPGWLGAGTRTRLPGFQACLCHFLAA